MKFGLNVQSYVLKLYFAGQMSVISDSYEKKDELFVETKAYKELQSVVEDRHWATLLGKPGDGKSTTATHLMLHYKRQGYQPLFVSSVRQWEMLVSSTPGVKQIVVIDDMFGAINLDDKITGEWLNEIEKMDKLVSERKGDLLVVCTSRKYIFTDVKSKLHKCQGFSDVNIVDMTDNEYQLSSNEKLSILLKYAYRYNIKLGDETVRQIKDVQSPHGFPHCVEMFCTNSFHRKIGAKFFSNPEKAVQKEVNNFKDNDPMKFLVLLLVMYHKNRFEKRHIGEMIASSDEHVKKLFSFLSIVQSTAYSGLMKAAKALTNTYLALTKDGYYTFTHESLAENVSKVYMELNPFHATQILSFQEILKHVNTPKENVDLPNYELAERITSELLMGNLEAVSSCASWRDKTFVDEWIKYITMQCKASCCWSSLSKITLKRILHIDIDSSVSDTFYPKRSSSSFFNTPISKREETLVTCLLKKGMEQAATAILSSKSIRKLLHTDQVWIIALEQALKLVCRTTRDMDVVKAIVEPHETNDAHDKILDGSAAFANAIETSDAECAQYIVENTKIMFGESNITSYFKGLENSSIGFAKFIQLFDNHEQSSEIKTKLLAYVILHTSSKKCLQMLSLLKDNGANFQCMNEKKFNALHIACKRYSKDLDFGVLKYLVDIGVDASQESSEGEVPLMLALQHNTKECIIKLLLPISPRKHKTKAGQGYFHYLMRSNCSFDTLSASCKMLLNEGEDANLQDASGTTPVMYLMQTLLSKQWRCHLSMHELSTFISYSKQTYASLFVETKLQDLLTSIPLNLHLTDNAGQNVLHHLFANRKYISLPWMSVGTRKETHQDSTLRKAYNLLVNKFNVDDQLKNKDGMTPNMLASRYLWCTDRSMPILK